MLAKFFILACISIVPKKINYCTCIPITVEDNYKKSDLIFIGEVLKVDTVNVIPQLFIDAKWATPDSGDFTTNCLVTMKLKKTLKGASETGSVCVMTGVGGGDCGFYFRLGKDYLVYSDKMKYYMVDSYDLKTSKNSTHLKEYFTTDNCDRTTNEVDKELRELKKYLKRAKKL